MKLSSGMEAWPIIRLGDRLPRIGRVSHIRPTTPKHQPTQENNHDKQAETTNTIRARGTQQK